jgi:hypothetical protein
MLAAWAKMALSLMWHLRALVNSESCTPLAMQPQQYYCYVCQIHCSGPITWNDHIIGKKHKENERKMAQQAGSMYNPAVPTDTQQPQEHLDLNHPPKRPKLQEQPFVAATDTNTMLLGGPQPSSPTGQPQTYIPPKLLNRNAAPPPPGKFYCSLCQCHMNDSHAYMLHMQGKKHQQSVKKQAPTSHSSNYTSSHKSNAARAKSFMYVRAFYIHS